MLGLHAWLTVAVLAQLGPEHATALEKCGPVRMVGGLEVELRVLASGKVAGAKILASDLSKESNACALKEIRTWVFPKRTDATDLRHRFWFEASPRATQQILVPGFLDKIGMIDLGVPLSRHPGCAQPCMLQMEVALMCTAFSKAHERLVAGQRFGDVVGPVQAAASGLCCQDFLAGIHAIDNVRNPPDQRTVWCFAANGPLADGGVATSCGAAECAGFDRFWKAYSQMPEDWFPPLPKETAPPRPVSKPKTEQL